MTKPRLLVLSLGGLITMVPSEPGGIPSPFLVWELLELPYGPG
jgi:hypothetical protein